LESAFESAKKWLVP